METATQEATKFATWAILEILGHVRHAGFVSEEIQFGVPMIRIDVPEVEGHTFEDYTYSKGKVQVTDAPIPAHTLYFGAGSVYSIKPCIEELAREACKQWRKRPIDVYLPNESIRTEIVLEPPKPRGRISSAPIYDADYDDRDPLGED